MFNTCSVIQYPGLGIARLRRALAGALAALALASAGAAAAATEVLYYFVDDRGTPHFSNVPMDKRYRPFAQVSVAPRGSAFDEGGVRLPYEADPGRMEDAGHMEHPEHLEDPTQAQDLMHEDTMQTEMSQEHLPVEVQEH